MDPDQIIWRRVPLALGAVATGLAVAAVLAYGAKSDGAWAVLAGVLVTALIGINPFSRRPDPGAIRASETAQMLSTFPPLARDVFESLPDPLMLLDQSGRVLFANAPMRAVVGVGPEGKHVSAILRTPSVLETIQRATRTGESASVEFSFRVPVERHFEAYAARMGTAPAVTALLLHDLTSLKRSEQMRVDFVANASHELRTPLAAVTGFIETLKGHARDDSQAREKFLDIMSVEANRMRRLIDDLLSLSRIELNEHVPPLGEVSLENVAREAAAALAPLARGDNISIDIVAGPDLPPVTGERDELIQLFQNLIHNAIKYGKQGGQVWVTLALVHGGGGRGRDTAIAASVRDDGEGIPSDAIPRLTERFYRVDVKRSREKGGTGLGLAIVKHIVNRHQGKLQIESRAGEGSTFTVTFPVARASTAAIAAAK
jgi:two-component system phosphate regulon sensor histidine kinase PhoR